MVRENGDAYNFPDKFNSYFRGKYSAPTVYRWRVLKNQPGDKEPICVGEAEELPRRIQRVRTALKVGKGYRHE